MLKSYLKTAVRNLIKNKSYSIINIAGLSVGLTCCILISLYIYQEMNYDDYFKNDNRIFRVSTISRTSEGIDKNAQTSMPVGPALKLNYPEIENFTRIYFADNVLMKYKDKKFYESKVIYADSDFFKVFSFDLLMGNSQNVLKNPYSIVLTKDIAKKYFGNNDPIGKKIKLEDKEYFNVTGVMDEVPVNTHFHFNFIASYSSLTPKFFGWDPSNQWGAYFGNYTYILTNRNFNPFEFETKTKNFIDEHLNPPSGTSVWLTYQPVRELHLISDFQGTPEPINTLNNLFIIAVIGLFVLLIACINFINITTSRSPQRAKEIGVRKTLGANKLNLVKQFIGESLLHTGLSLFFSVILVELSLPLFSNLIGEKIVSGLFNQPFLLTGIILITGLIGVFAGFYPAFILSKINVVFAVKGISEKRGNKGRSLLKKVLVVIQFGISIILIIATIIINNQIKFALNADLGFNKENILQVMVFDDKVSEKLNSFKDEIKKVPGVISATNCFAAPVSDFVVYTNIYPNGRKQAGGFLSSFDFVDNGFLDHFGIKLIAGRNFYKTRSNTDTASIIINETTMHKLGFIQPEDIIGKKYDIGMNRLNAAIIGVVKDFHFSSFHEKIKPFAFMNWNNLKHQTSVKINSANISQTIGGIKKVWEEFSSSYPFQYEFLDQTIDNLYKREERQESIVLTFSIIAIITACLGLFGLAAYSAQQRTKEIGIRKVFGATVSNIVRLISKEFLILTIVANIIAWPIAWYLMNKWLQDFAYKINISLFIFIFAGIITILITLLTVGFQSIRAALANPVESLRYE
jgi:putative ABC transport system permease protein